MTRLFPRLSRRLAAFLPEEMRREDGTAAMEFVLVIPIIMMIFMASFESGLLMTRSIMLEQSVDMTMRELRLGHISSVTNHKLKTEICSRTIIFPDCMNNMKIELHRVSTTTWDIPATPPHCVVRREPGEPVVSMNAGQQNDLMLVRVCVALEAMFPTTGIALDLPLDADGAYGLVARSAFVIEPT
jgi:Flp pilus assembly protein TadG